MLRESMHFKQPEPNFVCFCFENRTGTGTDKIIWVSVSATKSFSEKPIGYHRNKSCTHDFHRTVFLSPIDNIIKIVAISFAFSLNIERLFAIKHRTRRREIYTMARPSVCGGGGAAYERAF